MLKNVDDEREKIYLEDRKKNEKKNDTDKNDTDKNEKKKHCWNNILQCQYDVSSIVGKMWSEIARRQSDFFTVLNLWEGLIYKGITEANTKSDSSTWQENEHIYQSRSSQIPIPLIQKKGS